jgi:tetratricopeptide (TPR) repeat protein
VIRLFQRVWLFSVVFLSISSCSGLPHVIVPSDPLTAEEHVRLGGIYAREASYDDAQQQFQAALIKKPDFAPALVGLGNLSFEQGDYESAEQYYTRALKEAPGHPGASNNLAVVYVKQNRQFAEAEELCLRALPIGSSLKPYILHTLAEVYLKQRRYVEARSVLDQAESLAFPHQVALKDQLTQARAKLP